MRGIDTDRVRRPSRAMRGGLAVLAAITLTGATLSQVDTDPATAAGNDLQLASAMADLQQAVAKSGGNFLKIDGIPGDATDKAHAGEIQIDSFSWGVTNSGSTHVGGGGGGAGKAQFQDFHFSTATSKASPELMFATASGEHIDKAVLSVSSTGERPFDFFVVTLEDLLVSSFQSGGSTTLTDSFSLNFSKITVEHVTLKADGSRVSVKKSYDLKANTGA